jgi:hypothetical protein
MGIISLVNLASKPEVNDDHSQLAMKRFPLFHWCARNSLKRVYEALIQLLVRPIDFFDEVTLSRGDY